MVKVISAAGEIVCRVDSFHLTYANFRLLTQPIDDATASAFECCYCSTPVLHCQITNLTKENETTV